MITYFDTTMDMILYFVTAVEMSIYLPTMFAQAKIDLLLARMVLISCAVVLAKRSE